MTTTPTRSRFEHAWIEIDGLDFHYAHLPAARPVLVLLHGIGMDWRVWQAISRRFEPFFDQYMLDLRGHGQSAKPATGYLLPNYAADVEDFIDVLGLEGVVVIGSSLGGMVAAALETPPDIVSQRVLVDPPLTGGPIRGRAMFIEILRLKHAPSRELATYLADLNPQASPLYLRTMSEMWHQASDGVIEEMLASPDDYYDVDAALKTNEAPTLILRADPEQGGVLSKQEAERALHLLLRGTLAEFPGAGHAIHASQPSAFVSLVRTFVQGTPFAGSSGDAAGA